MNRRKIEAGDILMYKDSYLFISRRDRTSCYFYWLLEPEQVWNTKANILENNCKMIQEIKKC